MQDSEIDNKIDEQNIVKEEGDGRVYELGYVLVPTIPGEDVPVVFGNLKETISTFGGDFISEEMPHLIDLAYTMRKVISNIHHKFDTGYFGWIKFTMDAPKVVELKKKLDLDTNIVRFLILKTVRENTIAQKKFPRGDSAYRKSTVKKVEGEAPAAPIDEKEIDKEIDALIAA